MSNKVSDRVYLAMPDPDAVVHARTLCDMGYRDCVFGGADDVLNWSAATKVEMHAMLECDALHLPVGWENNRTNRLLRMVAIEIGIKVLYGKA